MPDFLEKHCVPCEGGTPPLTRDAEAVAFVNKVAELAESEGHHPNILIHSWNKVRLTLYTHVIGGLSENDFIMAAKVNLL